jgi:leucyl-tRNA synthetase
MVERSSGLAVLVGPNDKMSKSKRNTIDPQDIIARFGADTARWFVLSDNPPERDMEWTESGIAGAFRFTQRYYRLALSVAAGGATSAAAGVGSTLLQTAHRTIAAVTTALEQFAFNVAVARLHELLSAIAEEHRSVPSSVSVRVAMDIFCRLTAPMVPHLACETLVMLHGVEPGTVDLSWPVADPAMLLEESVTIAVQIGGKLRGTVSVPADAPEGEVIQSAMAEENVARLLAGKRVVKQVYVPRRIVNFVIADR